MINLKQFFSAMATIEEEKGIPHEVMLETIESAIATAYKKDYGSKGQVIRAKLDQDSGAFQLYQEKTVLDESMLRHEDDEEETEEETQDEQEQKQEQEQEGEEEVRKVWFNPERHIMLDEAKEIQSDIEVGGVLTFPLNYQDDFRRIAVQTAKQVVLQKIREAERNVVYDEFSDKVDTIISGIVQRIEGGYVFFDIGKATGIMRSQDTIPHERYRVGARLRVYVVEVERGVRGVQIFVSRSHPKMLEKLFELEVPEIQSGALEIKALAREAGSRSKIAVHSYDDTVDPIGSCVGQRGSRVTAVIQELGGEKIDIIEWSEDIEEFIASSLSPARVLQVDIEEEDAKVIVADDQLSLAIGRDGQNVRLAAKLTGYKIDIISKETGEVAESSEQSAQEEDEDEEVESEQETSAPEEDTSDTTEDETTKDEDTNEEEQTEDTGVVEEEKAEDTDVVEDETEKEKNNQE